MSGGGLPNGFRHLGGGRIGQYGLSVRAVTKTTLYNGFFLVTVPEHTILCTTYATT